MDVPAVNDAPLSRDVWPERGSADDQRARTVVRSIIAEAWTKLVRSPSAIMRIDLREIVGPSQIVARKEDGVEVLDLYLTFGLPPLGTCLDEDGASRKNRDHVRSVLFHEVFHIADRLDGAFGLTLHAPYGDTEQGRKMLDAVWDVHIESRKWRSYGIRPFSCFSIEYSGMDEGEAVLANLKGVLRRLGVPLANADEVFERVWGATEPLPFSRLTELATRFRGPRLR